MIRNADTGSSGKKTKTGIEARRVMASKNNPALGINSVGYPSSEPEPTWEPHSKQISFSEYFEEAFTLLLQGSDYAAELGRDRWDFAVDHITLAAAGLSDNDLRWLLLQGVIQHGVERTSVDRRHREFDLQDSLVFGERSRFVLTDEGICQWKTRDAQQAEMQPHIYWDSERHCLSCNGVIVKEFRLPSINQVCILSAFEEDGWPPRIDDPLPRDPDVHPKRRLNDAIKGLNRNQKHKLMRFHGDGTGQGVLWEVV